MSILEFLFSGSEKDTEIEMTISQLECCLLPLVEVSCNAHPEQGSIRGGSDIGVTSVEGLC